MVQRKVIVRGATNQALDELDAADIPDLAATYEAAGAAAAHAAGAAHAGLATDAEVATAVSDHSADTTAVHGITDAAALSLDTHDHDADYEAAGGIATHAGLANPHPGYLTPAEGDAAYDALGAAAAAAAASQPLDSDLTAIAALTTTAFGRSFLDRADAAAARTILALGTAALAATGDFDATGAAAAAQAASQPLDGDLTAIAALTTTAYGRAFLALADAAAARTALALGTAALSASGDFQPIDSDLTSIAALTTTAFGRALLELADAAAGRTALGLGSFAVLSSLAHSATTGITADDHHAQSHTHASHTGIGADDHHAQAHTAAHLPTGTDPVNKFSQSTIGTADQAIANTETVVLAKVFAAAELVAGQMYRFEAWFTKAGTNASSAVIRIRIGTTTLTGNIAATLTPPTNALAVPGKIEGLLWIVAAGAGGTARGSLQQFVHLAAVTITSAINPATATVAVDTTAANQRVELTFISGNAANTYTFRNAVMYRVA